MSKERPDHGSQHASQSQSQSQSQTQSQTQTQSQGGSSSSSAPTSASQSSSGSGTLSSVDTIPVMLSSVPEEPGPEPWGRLLPMEQGFRAHNCVEEEYTFGRGTKCSYIFDDPVLRQSDRWGTYSKKHFRIFREDNIVYIEDQSGNGTYVDGNLVGQGKKLPLANNAELALVQVNHKVFVFIDLMVNEQGDFPEEFKKKYLVTRKIGVGACGEVKLAFHRETCRKVAVKTINKKDFQSAGTATTNAEREIQILRKIDHPCLIKTEDFFQTEDSYYIVLELMEGGELYERIKAKHRLEEHIAKFYFYQMLKAVEYLHKNNIIHRDLKPENILLASQEDECLIKVTDFNQSKILEESSLMRTLCGTPTYLAPEVFTDAGTTGYSLAVDAWSLGVLLFVCLGGYPPFHKHSSPLSVREQIIQGVYAFIPSNWQDVSDPAKDLVRKLLVVDPSKRLTIQEALNHPWLQLASKRKRESEEEDEEEEKPTSKRVPTRT
ncbi:serine/threonine-protein kinase Chk2 [Aplochiton taeniatus]